MVIKPAILIIFACLYSSLAFSQKLNLNRIINQMYATKKYGLDTLYYIQEKELGFVEVSTDTCMKCVVISIFKNKEDLIKKMGNGHDVYFLSIFLKEVGLGVLKLDIDISLINKESFNRKIPIYGIWGSSVIECIFDEKQQTWNYSKTISEESM